MKKFEPKEIRMSLLEAQRQFHRDWGRFKFLHCRYLPIRFKYLACGIHSHK